MSQGKPLAHLEKHIPIPLYHQLSENLRQQIESGQLAPGERIPSVQELSASYNISPMTAQKAIGELVRLRLVEVRRGIGTFVADTKLTCDLQHLKSFSEDMLAHGLVAQGRLLHQALEDPSEHTAQRLNLEPGEKVVHIMRLRSYDDTPAALEESYLAASLCPGLEHEDVVGSSLYALLEGRYNLALDHTSQIMEVVGANAHEADLMGVPLQAPMSLVRGVTYLVDGRPIEYFKVVYRGDCFRFQLQTVRLRKEG